MARQLFQTKRIASVPQDECTKSPQPKLVAECINHVHVFFLLAPSEHCHSSVNVEVAMRP